MMRGFIKHFLLTVAAGSFILHLSAADRQSFSGRWALDVEASRFGHMMPPVDRGMMTISLAEHKLLRLEVSVKSANREQTTEDTWKIDDRYHPINGPTPGEILAKWEGPILLGKKQTVAGVEEIRFRLAPDRESLTQVIQKDGDITTLIWRRQ
jgi:hypothetical protein